MSFDEISQSMFDIISLLGKPQLDNLWSDAIYQYTYGSEKLD